MEDYTGDRHENRLCRKRDNSPLIAIAESPVLRVIARAAVTIICALLIFIGSRVLTTLDKAVDTMTAMQQDMTRLGTQIISLAEKANRNAEDIRWLARREGKPQQ